MGLKAEIIVSAASRLWGEFFLLMGTWTVANGVEEREQMADVDLELE